LLIAKCNIRLAITGGDSSLRRGHFRALKSSASKPPSNSVSRSSLYSNRRSAPVRRGPLIVPCSKRLANTHAPESSYTNTFSLLRRRLQNTKRSPRTGSPFMSLRPMPESPLKDFRMSVGPVAKKTRRPGKLNTIEGASTGSRLHPGQSRVQVQVWLRSQD
jgi:hypothetical protein